MTHLNPSELHEHRTSCLSGGEFPCHVTLDAEPFDPLWDNEGLQSHSCNAILSPRLSAAGKGHVSRNPQEEF